MDALGSVGFGCSEGHYVALILTVRGLYFVDLSGEDSRVGCLGPAGYRSATSDIRGDVYSLGKIIGATIFGRIYRFVFCLLAPRSLCSFQGLPASVTG